MTPGTEHIPPPAAQRTAFTLTFFLIMLATSFPTQTNRRRWAIAGCLALTIHLCLVFGIDNWSSTEPFKAPRAAPLIIELGRLSSSSEPVAPNPEKPLPATLKTPSTLEPEPPAKSPLQPTPSPEKPVSPNKAKTQPSEKSANNLTPDPPVTDNSPTETPPSSRSFTAPVTEPTPTRAPRVGAESTAQQDNQVSWQNRLLAHLQRHKRYPSIARQRRQQGTATIQFRIDRDGNVMTTDLVHSSGYVLLDRSAIEMVDRAQPLPRPPATVTDDELSLTLPVQFSLR